MEASTLHEETPGPTAHVVNLKEISNVDSAGVPLLRGNLSLISNVKVTVEVVVGGAEMTVGELFELHSGSVVSLDQLRDAPLVVRLDDKPIALGTLVVVDGYFGIRVTEVPPVPAIIEK